MAMMLAGTLACAQAQDTRAPLEPAPYASSPVTALMASCAPDAGSRRPPLPREIECAASLGLPSGPIADCRDAILATTVTAITGFVAWWYRGLDTRLAIAHIARLMNMLTRRGVLVEDMGLT